MTPVIFLPTKDRGWRNHEKHQKGRTWYLIAFVLWICTRFSRFLWVEMTKTKHSGQYHNHSIQRLSSFTSNPEFWWGSLQLWQNLFTYPNERLQLLHKHKRAHTSSRPVWRPSNNAPCSFCWHGMAWGMCRNKVYDSADVNDIIQILNQAAASSPQDPLLWLWAWKTWNGFLPRTRILSH